ncbi:MAG: MFS transporter [Chloroflexi bacterium]|nr:MFS transporter [Chloroflexota bacterium]
MSTDPAAKVAREPVEPAAPATTGVPPGPRASLYTRPFVALCALVLLGFCSFSVVNPVIPVIVIDAGGDAALAGIIVAVFSVPSVLLRPFFGRLVDEWSKRRVLTLGIGGLTLSSLLYLVPGIGPMVGVRLLHGTAWGAFNTGGNSTLAEIAPPERRGEASGIYGLMPGVAQMVMPALGLALLGMWGPPAPFLFAAMLGLVGLGIAIFGPGLAWRPATRPATPRASGVGSLIERRVVLPMTLEFLWMSTNCLFFIFPPVWAREHGIPIEALALYYPAMGFAMVAARIVIGPRLDRVARGWPVIMGAGLGVVGLVVAVVAQDVAMLTVGGVLYAIAAALTSPIHLAIAMDRASAGRVGAAMATYSLGYQLGLGIGSAAYGVVISMAGFPAPFVIGMGAMGLMMAAIVGGRGELLRPRVAT